MNDEESLEPNGISDDFSPKKLRPYDLLLRQSRKMGGLATRTYDVTKEFLKQDVSALHPDKVLFGAARPEKPSDKLYNRADQVTNDYQDVSDGDLGGVEARPNDGIRDVGGESDTRTLDPREKLQRIVQKSHQILAGAQTVILPINLFPDSVIVDRTKVTITKRTFFWSANVISIRIEDVLNVSVSTGPLFGSLTVSSRVMNSTDHYEINYFWRKDALYLKQIIQGYVIAQHNRIETSHLKRQELVDTLLELGRDSGY